MREVAVADGSSVPDGEIVAVTVNGRAIAIARRGEKVYALDNNCTHEECPLSDGFIEGNDVECWLHGARFDLETGAVTLPPATESLTVHAASERAGKIYVSLAESAVVS